MTLNPNSRRAARLATLAGALSAALLAGACASSGTESATTARPAGSYAFWPQAPAEPRIQFVRSFRSSRDVVERRSGGFERLIFGEETEYEAVIEKPYGVEMSDGRIYVCDIRRPAVTVLDLRKKQVRLLGVSGVNRVTHPVDVAVADDGKIYVADNERNAILVFDRSERFERVIGHTDMQPVSVAVHDDRLYMCDIKNQRIEIFDRATGDSIGTIGSVGDGEGQFRVPLAVETDREGNVYVSDMMRCRMQKFRPDGTFVEGWGELGDYAGSFARPKQLAVDRDGIIYVVDAAFNNVQMFNNEWGLLMAFGFAGSFPGAMNLPAGICVSDEGLDLIKDEIHPGFEPVRLVAVTNQFGPDKVSLYCLGRLRDGWTVAQLATSQLEVSEGVGETAPAARRLQSEGGVPGGPASAPPPSEGEGGGG